MSARRGELWENESREAQNSEKTIRVNRFSTVGGSGEELKLGFKSNLKDSSQLICCVY